MAFEGFVGGENSGWTNANMGLRDQWQRLVAIATPIASDLVGSMNLSVSGGVQPAEGDVIYADAMMVENNTIATVYTDGDVGGGAWVGTPHASATVRGRSTRTQVDLLHDRPDSIFLNAVRPQVAQYKGGGTYRSSPFADGRRLVDTKFDNVIETFELKARGTSQDAMIQEMQEIRRLLLKASDYWTTSWQNDPVWLEAQASRESNPRYALIHSGTIAEDENPWSTPFLQPGCEAVMDNLTMVVERGHWQANEPNAVTQTEISAMQSFIIGDMEARPNASADDADVDVNGSSIDLVGHLDFGFGGVAALHVGVRFANVLIPQGATIDSAVVTFRAQSNQAGNITDIIVRGEDVNDAAAFSTYADFIGRMTSSSTTNTVDWDITADWFLNIAYSTPDISTIIQEIVNRPNWESGNAIVIFIDCSSIVGANDRIAFSYDTATTTAFHPLLTVGTSV
jgi:hypothetical protein